MALSLESGQVIDNLAAKEGAAIFECWFIDNHLCTLCLDTLHDALNCRLAEVVGIGFHRQAIDTDHTIVLLACIIAVIISIAIITCLLENGISDIVLTGTVTLYDCLNQVLRNISIALNLK